MLRNSKLILVLLLICMVPLLIGMKQDDGASQEPNTISPRDLVVRYAKTRMDLAQVEYDWAKQPTSTGQLVMSKAKLERRRSELAVAKEQFKQAVNASTGSLEKSVCAMQKRRSGWPNRITRLPRNQASWVSTL
jgi:hypothetical protein